MSESTTNTPGTETVIDILRSDLPSEFGLADIEAVHAAKAGALGFETREERLTVIVRVSRNVFVEMEKEWNSKYMHWFSSIDSVNGLTKGTLCGMRFDVGDFEPEVPVMQEQGVEADGAGI